MRKGKAIDSEKRAIAKEAAALRTQLEAADARAAAALAEAAAENDAVQRAAVAAAVQESSAQVREKLNSAVMILSLFKPTNFMAISSVSDLPER